VLCTGIVGSWGGTLSVGGPDEDELLELPVLGMDAVGSDGLSEDREDLRYKVSI
jgi:hypothetical protein